MSELELTMMRRVGELNKENARLKAEVEHLMIFCNCTLIPNKELQAEVKRLTKAGDAMAEGLLKYIEPTDGYLTYLECKANWNAAKEGNGQS